MHDFGPLARTQETVVDNDFGNVQSHLVGASVIKEHDLVGGTENARLGSGRAEVTLQVGLGVVLVEGDTETPLKAGECAGFKAGEPVGHHIINKSSEVAILFEVGTRCDNEVCHYTGLDFTYRKVKGVVTFVNKDGSIAS